MTDALETLLILGGGLVILIVGSFWIRWLARPRWCVCGHGRGTHWSGRKDEPCLICSSACPGWKEAP